MRKVSGYGWGRRNLIFFLAFRAIARTLVDIFRKNEKKNKTTSGYRLYIIRLSENEDFQVHKGIIFLAGLFNNPPRLDALVVIQIFARYIWIASTSLQQYKHI